MAPSDNTTTATPYSFAPSQFWDGNDGSWSSFIVRTGTPSQSFRVFPSTTGQETLVPLPEGCTPSDPANCGSLRGVMPFEGVQGTGFQFNESTTWEYIGLYTSDIETALDFQINALYGLDTVGLQIENSGGLTQTSQVIGGIAAKELYHGVFGLGPKPSNFSSYNDPIPSFMSNLNESNIIPSLSYGYTAGASYRNNKVLGSLTLGGYDSSRFTPSNISFAFASDDSKPLQVGMRSIVATNTLIGTVNVLPTPIFSTIDSTLPYIWLPQDACSAFAAAFGLEYDNTTDLYLVNDTIHEQLLDLGTTLAFVLGTSLFDAPNATQSISLPYEAFDLQASDPIYPNATRYFPIRRAENDTQYIIGRTLLQEAYLLVDYERSNFTVAQASFADPMPEEQIVPILRPSTKSPGSGLSGGAIAGIVVGAIAVVALVAGLILLLRRRKRAKKNVADPSDAAAGPEDSSGEKRELAHLIEADTKVISEVDDNHISEAPGEVVRLPPGGLQELHDTGSGTVGKTELDTSNGHTRAELSGNLEVAYELEGNSTFNRPVR